MSDQPADILADRQAPRPRDILEVIATHLAAACECVQAGFYFEEGGCFGMALEIHSVLSAAGVDAQLAVYENHSHALVVVGDDRYDYQGRMFNATVPIKTLGPLEFLAVAGEAGHSDEDLFGAQEYARTALTVAFELSGAEPGDARAPDAGAGGGANWVRNIENAPMSGYSENQVAFNHAADNGNLRRMASALDNGAGINEQDNVGRTALNIAINFGRWPVVDMLLSRGADPNIAEISGFTALHRLVESMSYSTDVDTDYLRRLLKVGANVGAIDNSGKTALHVGVEFGCPQEGLSILVEHGLDIDARDKLGRTALHRAAQEGAAEMIGWLLESGAAEAAVDSEGRTPRELASQQGVGAFEAWHARQAVNRVINRSLPAPHGGRP